MAQTEIFRASFSSSDSLQERLQYPRGNSDELSVAPRPLFVCTEPQDNVNPVPAAGGIDGVPGDQLLLKGAPEFPVRVLLHLYGHLESVGRDQDVGSGLARVPAFGLSVHRLGQARIEAM